MPPSCASNGPASDLGASRWGGACAACVVDSAAAEEAAAAAAEAAAQPDAPRSAAGDAEAALNSGEAGRTPVS